MIIKLMKIFEMPDIALMESISKYRQFSFHEMLVLRNTFVNHGANWLQRC